jgi:hypothetical protein
VPYSREFKSVKHNAALLKQLADMTGGRELDEDPALVDLFDPERLEIPKSPREIWDLLAIFAAALFVFDVAARRISIDPRIMALLAGRAIGKRADASTETVSAWKRARSQVAHRKPDERPRRTSEDRQVKFEATQADASLAIDVGAETPQDMRAQPQAAPKPRPAAPTSQDDGDYTSRLLAAKRRARGDDEGPADAKQDKPNA